MPKVVRDELQKRKSGAVLAGGFIRACIAGEPVSDVDLFVPSKAAASELADSLLGPGKRRIETDNAFTILGHGLPIQVIHRWVFDEPRKIVPSFDFTIACAAIWWEDDGKWISACDDRFYPDLAAKRLVYRAPDRNEDAGGSILRLLKFYRRGYQAPLESIAQVVARMLKDVPEVNFQKREVILSEGGAAEWEKQMGAVLMGLLREVDPAFDSNLILENGSASDPEATA